MSKLKIILTKHVKMRMKERSILLSDVSKAVTHPSLVNPSFTNTVRIQKIIRGRTLEIICVTEKKRVIIITAYYL